MLCFLLYLALLFIRKRGNISLDGLATKKNRKFSGYLIMIKYPLYSISSISLTHGLTKIVLSHGLHYFQYSLICILTVGVYMVSEISKIRILKILLMQCEIPIFYYQNPFN